MAETITPQPGPQQQFLASPADITVFGGAAGGGKTYALLLEPLRHIHNPNFGAVLFRQTFPQIMLEGGLWDEAEKIYPLLGAKPNRSSLEWRFPSGARVSFAHLQHEADKFKYQGAQIAFLGFDQLELFTAGQFWFMFARNRSTCGVRPYIRATCNPDPESWLAEFVAWWLAEDGYADLDRAGRLRYFVRVGERLEWDDDRAVLETRFPGQYAKSVTFIPSSVYDNQILLERDPGYLANLMALPPVEQARLLGDAKRGGNWKVRPAAGKVFNRGWFEVVPAVPAGGTECRFWDFAATEKEQKGPSPCYTAGVRMRKVGGTYYITDCIAVQAGPAQVEQLFKNTSAQDAQAARATGTAYLVRWEEEPGSAGIRESARLVKLLAGMDARPVKPQGEKLARAAPLAAQAYAGNVKLVAGPWNERWLSHMHHQPDIKDKDIMDASSGAFAALTGMGWVWKA